MALRVDSFDFKQYLEKAMVDLPALPTVIVQVLRATEKETVTTTEIEGLLATDAAITTKLLKVVNSAYFGLPRQVGSVNQAIAILGMHQVRNLVLSIGVLNALSSPNSRVAELQSAFWEHSFASATCAQVLAKRKGLSGSEQDLVFVGGLLHDIGQLFLLTQFNQQYQAVTNEANRTGEPISAVEARILGADHAQLGGLLAERWNFPPKLVGLIRGHEVPEECTDTELLGSLHCVHASDRLASELWSDSEGSSVWAWSPASVEWLDLSPEATQELRAEVSEYLQRSKDLLGML